jgi:hypothetical protein
MARRLPPLLLCAAFAILAYVCLDFWSSRNAPLYKRFERQWKEDVEQLENSKKLPPAWFDVRDLEIYGGTPESKDWLGRIQVPLRTRAEGKHKLEVLVVAWEEDGKRGTLVQYNLVDLKTGNNIWELGRTFILTRPPLANPLADLLEELKHL